MDKLSNKMVVPYRYIVRKGEGAVDLLELNTKPADGTVEIQSVTVTNVDSTTKRIVIGIRGFVEGSTVDPAWHPVGEPFADVAPNHSRCTTCKFYLENGEMVYANFEGIGKPYSRLKLNVQGKYLSKT
jgi:stage V sporulation protein SpoVS